MPDADDVASPGVTPGRADADQEKEYRWQMGKLLGALENIQTDQNNALFFVCVCVWVRIELYQNGILIKCFVRSRLVRRGLSGGRLENTRGRRREMRGE